MVNSVCVDDWMIAEWDIIASNEQEVKNHSK